MKFKLKNICKPIDIWKREWNMGEGIRLVEISDHRIRTSQTIAIDKWKTFFLDKIREYRFLQTPSSDFYEKKKKNEVNGKLQVLIAAPKHLFSSIN